MPAGPSVSLWASIGTLVLAIAVVRCALVPPAARYRQAFPILSDQVPMPAAPQDADRA